MERGVQQRCCLFPSPEAKSGVLWASAGSEIPGIQVCLAEGMSCAPHGDNCNSSDGLYSHCVVNVHLTSERLAL